MINDLEQKLRRIKLLISDVDGVLTNGSIYKGNEGVEFKQFSVLDGAAVAFARTAGLKLAVISGRYSPATTARMEELGVDDCYQGGLDKKKPYREILNKHELQDEEVSFIGDDLIDAPVMERVGVAIAVENAHPFIKEIAHFTTEKSGGEGVLREAVELILKSQGVYDETIRRIREQI
ncbi:MAG: HAD hydrolase family protein [Candidatus Neomarinimicrobiota bacterium]|nr:HAD hydrolase family protein [Candidatus Neomarinimicrobiota bacterium]